MAGVSTKEIKNRIRSMESTRQITKAMEMVAASKLRRAQSQVLDDVACVSAQLVAHALVDLCQVTILVVVLMSPLGQTRDDALQVLHAILVGLHVVVAQVFGL